MTAPQTFTCPRCGATSHNPNDVREAYCGRCHDWTRPSEPLVLPPLRPPIERLVEGWDALVPVLDPLLAEAPAEKRMEIMQLVLIVGMAVEELR